MLNIKNKKLWGFLVVATLSFTSTAQGTSTTISLSQVTKDVTYLASDELKGRSNFSDDIHQAADYITKRFEEVGLSPVAGNNGFYQKYSVKTITPKTIALSLNNKVIATDNIAFASTAKNFIWTMNNKEKKPSNVEIHTVGKDDDMRAALRQLNAQGGQHIVLLHPAHQDMFKRYQHYFTQGITKLNSVKPSSQQGGAIVIALTDISAERIKSLSVKASSTISTTELTNVVAVLPGNTKKDEVVLYSAHYDHLGTKENKEGNDVVYNGADDDASGTAAIINLAQHFAKQGGNSRTLMFAAFSAEEIGGFGSRYFSQQLDAKTITAMINIEMIGKPSKFGAGTVWMTGMERSDLGAQLNAALADTTMKIYQDPYPEQDLFYRSDNATLARLGVPAHSFSSTQLDKDEHYHQVSDDLASLNLPSMHKVIKAIAIATQPLVDGKITPSRIDTNLVKGKGLIY
ncbi:MAG: M20/M25/M40 family metallo-hydrolase [Colwellia sp.]|nr:M20/M25/M40 family metallo-hydrolase [Colwellia sp.]MCW8866038.1 M20/M25/M40 family metallo-hydrolase [Colwellia sp.]MCW9081631.1 M20/M25/M40 family metallo-hydrolase [Colwellia sp.]